MFSLSMKQSMFHKSTLFWLLYCQKPGTGKCEGILKPLYDSGNMRFKCAINFVRVT